MVGDKPDIRRSFLDATSHLNKMVRPSVRPSITSSLKRLEGASYAEYSALFTQTRVHCCESLRLSHFQAPSSRSNQAATINILKTFLKVIVFIILDVRERLAWQSKNKKQSNKRVMGLGKLMHIAQFNEYLDYFSAKTEPINKLISNEGIFIS